MCDIYTTLLTRFSQTQQTPHNNNQVKAGKAAFAAGVPKTYPREKQDYEGQVG